MLGFSTSFGFLLSQKLPLDEVLSTSGSLGRGRMSTGRDTVSLPRLEVSLSGGAGGFSSSSEDIIFSKLARAKKGKSF